MLTAQNVIGIKRGRGMKMLGKACGTNIPIWDRCYNQRFSLTGSSLHKKMPERTITKGMAGCQVSFTFFLIFLCIR